MERMLKKHLRVRELVEVLQDDQTTMGSDVHCVVVMGDREYPVLGAEAYDGVFCRILLGDAFQGVEGHGDGIVKGDDVFVFSSE